MEAPYKYKVVFPSTKKKKKKIQGSNNNAPVTEVAVVGGTGKFGFARGYVTSKTYSLDIATQNSVVQLNVTVQHY